MNETTQQVLHFQKSLAAIQNAFGSKAPDCAIVLGSGLNKVVDEFNVTQSLSYEDIPHFPNPKLQGHSGKLHLGKSGDKSVLIFSGRFHHYQGLPNSIAAAPAWVSSFWKIPVLIVTNASGGISLPAGSMALIQDHLFLQGDSPLRGVMLPDWENPFSDMTQSYDVKLQKSIGATAKKLKLTLRKGTYACVCGPSFETPAEIQMFKKLGCHMVGMSTVPEVLVARKMGMRVLGISMVANAAAGIGGMKKIDHHDVLASIQSSQKHVAKLLSTWLATADL